MYFLGSFIFPNLFVSFPFSSAIFVWLYRLFFNMHTYVGERFGILFGSVPNNMRKNHLGKDTRHKRVYPRNSSPRDERTMVSTSSFISRTEE